MIIDNMIQVGLGFIVIPWIVWVSTSVFSQRQEIAVMKRSHEDLKEMIGTLIDLFQEKKATKKK